MLTIAGLTAQEERAYRLLVRTAGVTPAELSEQLGIDHATADATLRTLHAKGLARCLQDGYSAVAPDVALGPVVHRRQEQVDSAREAIGQLTEEYLTHARRRDAGQLIEVLTSRSALRQQLSQLQDNARHEVLAFCRAGHVAMSSEENTEELAALGRGVRFRVLYESALIEQPGMLANIAEGIRLGEEARAVPNLPVRMMIADGELAILPLIQHTDGLTEPTAALVRRSNLLDALNALFESFWARATPIELAESGEALDSDNLYLLSLLMAGVPDKTIATQLKISHRTVQRRVNQLMELAGVQTRMQLAWHAAREHWL